MEYVIFIVPVIITIVGYLMKKYPPQKVNWFIGYRTRKSMKDEQVWKKANKYCGELWIKIGSKMLAIACLICLFIYFEIITLSEMILTIIIFCEIIPLLVSGIMVENKIKNDK